MQADKQVGLHAKGFLHPHMQRHKEVPVAGEKGAHRVAVDGSRIDAFSQPQGQPQHHVFFAGAGRADRAGVFTPMAGIQRHDDEALGGRCGHAQAGCWTRGFRVF